MRVMIVVEEEDCVMMVRVVRGGMYKIMVSGDTVNRCDDGEGGEGWQVQDNGIW